MFTLGGKSGFRFTTVMKILVILTILAVLFLTTESREYEYHLTLKPNVFDVYWSVNTTNLHKTFYIKFVAKTTGWAALGWTKKPEGRNMLQYDIALGGVRNGNESYLKVRVSELKLLKANINLPFRSFEANSK